MLDLIGNLLHMTSLCAFFPPSLCSATPSQKYSQRGGKGEVVVTFGAVQGTRWVGRKAPGVGVQLDLLEAPEDSLRSSYKYMFQRLRDIRNGTKQYRLICGDQCQTYCHLLFLHIQHSP